MFSYLSPIGELAKDLFIANGGRLSPKECVDAARYFFDAHRYDEARGVGDSISPDEDREKAQPLDTLFDAPLAEQEEEGSNGHPQFQYQPGEWGFFWNDGPRAVITRLSELLSPALAYSYKAEDGYVYKHFLPMSYGFPAELNVPYKIVEIGPEPATDWPAPDSNSSRPPIGLLTNEHWVRGRVRDILEAMIRYSDAGRQIPKSWIEELRNTILV